MVLQLDTKYMQYFRIFNNAKMSSINRNKVLFARARVFFSICSFVSSCDSLVINKYCKESFSFQCNDIHNSRSFKLNDRHFSYFIHTNRNNVEYFSISMVKQIDLNFTQN